MTYLTIVTRRGTQGKYGRVLLKTYIKSMKNTPEFKEFIEIVSEALQESS